MTAGRDRFGLSWRPAWAAGILAQPQRVDLVEVIAEDWFDAGRDGHAALATLAAQVPITLHGVGLGMASSSPVDPRRLLQMARLIDTCRPQCWSEHLSFVRSDGIELGHLAVPPRSAATVAGAVRNLERAARVTGSWPLVENVATLLEPPGSTMPEADWIAAILGETRCDLLLDLHNLFTNAHNLGFDPRAYLDRIPAERIAAVHLAGGRWIGPAGARRRLDDHCHDVPEVVFGLLTEVGARAPGPLSVVLERDGAFPPIEHALAELDRARAALALGRTRRGGAAA